MAEKANPRQPEHEPSGTIPADAVPEDQSARAGAPTVLGTKNRPLVYTGQLAVTAKDVPDAASKAIATTLADAAMAEVRTQVRSLDRNAYAVAEAYAATPPVEGPLPAR